MSYESGKVTESELQVRYFADMKELFEMVRERESRLQETAP